MIGLYAIWDNIKRKNKTQKVKKVKTQKKKNNIGKIDEKEDIYINGTLF